MTAEIQPALGFGLNPTVSPNGVTIRRDDAQRVSLNDLWVAFGSIKGRDPRLFLDLDTTRRFVDFLANSLNVEKTDIKKTTRGRNGGSWGHRKLAVAYAEYVSDEAHAFVINAFEEWSEEQVNPDLKADRAIAGYRRHKMTDEQILERIQGKLVRHTLTDVLKDHKVEPGLGFALCTDDVNVPVLGAPAAAIKRRLGLPKSAPTRDFISAAELTAIRLAELMAAEAIVTENAYGTSACRDVCRRAGEAVGSAMAQFRDGRSLQSA